MWNGVKCDYGIELTKKEKIVTVDDIVKCIDNYRLDKF